ncbi:T9SS type A sorting domain-containing protein [Chryseobacterium terrae]|uniref:T9SS type A sorting domain-containing protein n=1 Tax=Chryseobacterium terrae TaxID=3163299 RepID=A0ABW8Y4H3_9FLAO
MRKLITLLCTGLMVFVAHAQWNPNTDQNLLVADLGSGGASFSEITNDGKTYIVFWKQVAAPTNFELRLQILDQDGFKQLGNDGVLLSNQIPMSASTVFNKSTLDAAGNLYVGVTGTGAGTPAYVFKITPQGTSVWPNGINVGAGYLPTILPLSNNDIIVGIASITEPHMQVQRFNSSGQPVWANPIAIASTNFSKSTTPADFFELPNNEVELIFHERTTASGTGSYLFAQKIDFNGNTVWDGAKQISNQSTYYNSFYKGVQDGDVIYYGYTSGANNRFDSYLQRINADGSLPWGAYGADFDTNQTFFEKNMRIAFEPGSQYIWAIAQYTPSSQGTAGEYIQKFDKTTGARLFTNNGKQVFPIDNNMMAHDGDLHLLNGNPYFLVDKRIHDGLLPFSLNAVLLDSNGDFAWTQKYIPIATFNATKGSINSLKPFNNRSVVVFQEKKTADVNDMVYAQSLIIPASNLGVNDVVKTKNLKLYPNPAVDIIHVDGVKDNSFTIYNLVGQIVKSGVTKNGEIAVRELLKGEYILKIKGQEKSAKFIKK